MKILFLLSLSFLMSCANLKSNRDITAHLTTEDTQVKDLKIVDDKDIENASEAKLKYDVKEESLDGEYEALDRIPVEVNVAVEKWIDYFTGKGKKHMEKYLSRSSRYIPLMKKILKEEGVPEDLVYISLIESGFNSGAYSHAAAVGYWQFIRGTAKRYGLRMDAHVDERRDFVRSTQAAAQYMKALYNLFGDWYLAMASYNVGENRVKRMVMNYYTRDFWELARRKKLPRETINYVPKYIAAKLIAKNPKKYGFGHVKFQDPLSFQEMEVDQAVHLEKFASGLGLSYEELKKLNPMYRNKIAMPASGKKTVIKVPPQTFSKAKEVVANYYISDPQVIASMQSPDHVRYRVRRGDNLGLIARRFRTRVSTIRNLNGIRGNLIRAGQTILVPAHSSYIANTSSGVHKVRRGENLSQIASRYGTTVSAIKSANGLSSNRIYVGANLKIPSSSAASTKPSHHKVRRGENLSLIAAKYGLSVSQLKAYNNMQTSRIHAGQTLKLSGKVRSSGKQYHVVSRGENLGLIAKKYNLSVRNLKAMNGLRSSIIYPGKKLRVAGNVASNSSHVVRPGDTLIDIAKRYNTSVRNIATVNGLNNNSYIQVGKTLVIPD